MWMVELNVAGFKFVHYVPGRRRFSFAPRAFAWRPAAQRPQTAA